MAIINGNKAAQENLVEIAKLCCMAALRAPQMTGKVEVKTEIITGEDILPIIEYGESMLNAAASALPEAFPTFLRAQLLLGKKRQLLEEGLSPVYILIGSNSFLRSELNWNCGACGWNTCAEFNRYSSHIKKTVPGRQRGPCCHWKYMDYIGACCLASLVPWDHNVECRMLTVEATVCHALGYLSDCADVQMLGIGPCQDLFWFARGTPTDQLDEMTAQVYWELSALQGMPNLWNTFFGTMEALYKYDPRKYQQERKHLRLVDEEITPALQAASEEHLKAVVQIRRKVEEKRRAQKEAELPPDLPPEEKEKLLGRLPTEEEIERELRGEWPLLKYIIGGGQL